MFLPARFARPAALLVALPVWASVTHAQSVRGLLLDALTTRPIGEATVILLDSASAERSTIMTDSLGRFLITSPSPGGYRLQIRRIGYKAATSEPLAFERARTTQLTIELAPLAAELRPITVRERSARQWAVDGFRERQSLGKGVFIDRVDILAQAPIYFTDLFRPIPGLRVVMAGSGLQVESQRGRGCLRLFINWIPFEGLNEAGQRSLELPPPKEVMGIEVYREFGEVPQALRSFARTPPPPAPELIVLRSGRVTPASRPPPQVEGPKQCGLVLIWTKTSWNR